MGTAQLEHACRVVARHLGDFGEDAVHGGSQGVRAGLFDEFERTGDGLLDQLGRARTVGSEQRASMKAPAASGSSGYSRKMKCTLPVSIYLALSCG